MNESVGEGAGWLRGEIGRVQKLESRIPLLNAVSETRDMSLQGFIENLKIVNKRGELVPLIMNRSQEIVFHRLLQCRWDKRPARFICCKSRQLGISTLIEAFIFALVTLYPNRFALVVAHSMESAGGIFRMARRFHTNLGQGADLLSRNSVRLIEYAQPHNSWLQIDTATNRNLGRGGTLHYVHASEIAFWEDPEEPALAINQAVPLNWDTLVFWESTANGRQNLFHRMWVAAERGEIDMEPIFLSWKGFPEYSLPVAAGEDLGLNSDDTDYQRRHRLTPGESKWARYIRINQCHNSWDKFHQEYPIQAHLAFAFTGMPWFDRDAVSDLLEHVARAPLARGCLRFSDDRPSAPEFVELAEGPLMVWAWPEPSHTYSLGMDVGEGVSADYTVIQVICNESREVVATYRSNRVRAEQAGVEAYLLGAWHNYGLLGVERNGPGLATLAVCERGLSEYPEMSGYPNLYYHTWTDRKLPEETRRLGWVTNRTTKETMLSRLAQVVADRGLTIFSRTTLLEMQGFVWDAERKSFKQTYKAPDSTLTHDDEIMALAIANEMRLHQWSNRFIETATLQDGAF